jgi:hypothetical protein
MAIVLLCGIVSELAERGKDKPHGSRLGQKRYVVERAMSWWPHFQALHELAVAVICANKLRAARAHKRAAAQPPQPPSSARPAFFPQFSHAQRDVTGTPCEMLSDGQAVFEGKIDERQKATSAAGKDPDHG